MRGKLLRMLMVGKMLLLLLKMGCVRMRRKLRRRWAVGISMVLRVHGHHHAGWVHGVGWRRLLMMRGMRVLLLILAVRRARHRRVTVGPLHMHG